MKTAQHITLAAYALALSVWSGNIMLGSGGHWLAGAAPVAGWCFTLARFDLWASAFALMMALWFSCTAAVVVLRVVGSPSRPRIGSRNDPGAS